MSAGNRFRFRADTPFPERGVTSPDVFPSQVQEGHRRLALHDILDGSIPKVRRGQTIRSGWLRIALGNGPAIDYTSPNMGEGERELVLRRQRRTLDIDIDVEETNTISRTTTTLVQTELEFPTFDGRTFKFPVAKGRQLMKETPAERAVAFRGIASVQGTEAMVSGIHFDSCQELGWIMLGEPPEPLDSVA